MRVKDAFDVLVSETPPIGVRLERRKSTVLHVNLPLNERREEQSMLDNVSISFLWTILGVLSTLVLVSVGMKELALVVVIVGVLVLIGTFQEEEKKTPKEKEKPIYLSLELTAKGGALYKHMEGVEKKLQAQYDWEKLVAVTIKKVPKSKEQPTPYYIHLQTKNAVIRLFNGQLSTEAVSYAASMIEALLEQRYRGTVPKDWRRKLEVLEEPLLIDWSEHLIDD